MRFAAALMLIFFCLTGFSQQRAADSLFLMNGRIVVAPVIDTLLGAATFVDPQDTSKRSHVENDQLFAIKYHDGTVSYYYKQDTISNWFSRDEMWLFMQGERDARKGFKPKGSLFGSMACGIAGGLTGSLLGPIPAVAYTSLVGLPKVRIRHNTVSDIRLLDHDAYILGYEREARAKRRIWALIGSGVGMLVGYSTYFVWLKHEPNYPF